MIYTREEHIEGILKAHKKAQDDKLTQSILETQSTRRKPKKVINNDLRNYECDRALEINRRLGR